MSAVFGAIGFTTPWLLWGLAGLPVLWLLLRAAPPAPVRRRFPGVVLLLGLRDDDSQSDRTPWWLLLLRTLLVAALIVGLAGPVLNPREQRAGAGPVLILLDGTWAGARDWPRRRERVASLLGRAGRAGRPVHVMALTRPDPVPPAFQAANVWAGRLAGLVPAPWEPDRDAVLTWAADLGPARFDTWWISDGLARDGRPALLDALEGRGEVTVFQSARPVIGLRPPRLEDGAVSLVAVREQGGAGLERVVNALGPDPAGQERVLARQSVTFAPQALEAEAGFDLPPELLGRISRFVIEGERSAGAVALTDDALKRREVALIAGQSPREGLQLLSPTHYLEKALAPTADLIGGALPDILPANPDVIVLADVAVLPEEQALALAEWVERGGMLLRFAGPRLAASDLSRAREDPLMPVRLRRGGRSVGGALSWGEPKRLQPFAESSPFYGLAIPADVSVTSQVVAQPDPELSARVIAALSDGTPLVTRKRLGAGQVVLFHVTANAEWSSLPLSGLFVGMLERLAVSGHSAGLAEAELTGATWIAETVLDGFGAPGDAGAVAGVDGARLAGGTPARDMPPGVYSAAGRDRGVALNIMASGARLAPAEWPATQRVEGLEVARETRLKGALMAAALLLLILDTLAALWVAGRLRGLRRVAGTTGRTATGATLLAVALMAGAAGDGRAQTPGGNGDDGALALTRDVVLAHVITGDAGVDRVARAGLRGLTGILSNRTAVEPAEPVGVNPERDDLSFFPLLYWPVSVAQPVPSDAANARLNRYLRDGGMILFDTRDAGFGTGQSAEAQHLRRLVRGLDIPPLERVPADHVLTRAFYLLQDFPGRHAGRQVWVEAAPPDAERIEGMPFRNLNDGVTPVIIGGNDWAGAWATDRYDNPMFPVGRGYAGERQREIAYRFGINLVMHVLTGNYKSDQVHVPALLDRLGQ